MMTKTWFGKEKEAHSASFSLHFSIQIFKLYSCISLNSYLKSGGENDRYKKKQALHEFAEYSIYNPSIF